MAWVIFVNRFIVLVMLWEIQDQWWDRKPSHKLSERDAKIELLLIDWWGTHNAFFKRMRDDVEEWAQKESQAVKYITFFSGRFLKRRDIKPA